MFKEELGMTGTLRRINDEFTLNGTLLARCNSSDPVSAGASFIINNGFDDGDFVDVEGSSGNVGDLSVFCMTSISAAVLAAPAIARRMAAAAPSKAAAKKAAKRAAPKKAATRPAPAKKKAAKKKVTKKRAATKKPPAKSARKRK